MALVAIPLPPKTGWISVQSITSDHLVSPGRDLNRVTVVA
jgi:hypothetical protein